MGIVYLAVRNDDAFQKRVAIKVLNRGMDTDSIVRRFRNERQILATLEHPFIASLFDGGTTSDGLPYFAMEFVEGERIVEYCDAKALDTTARLELFRKVCSAVQYAHQNLIIHRDIKPANVLVTWDGTPKLLDFGIAKLLNPELAGETLAPTALGPQMMTPEYASPEQVRGEIVTTATDVYSLGVLLYELLTGRRPYRLSSRTPAEIARVVCDSVPVPPSTAVTQIVDAEGARLPAHDTPTVPATSSRTRSIDAERLRRRLAGDLDNIVLKALSKEPSRRYASVDQFSEDLRRHIAGLPVIARKDTFGYRAAKFIQRNRLAVGAAAVVFLALVAGILGTTWQAGEARRERLRAEQRFNDVRQLANASLFELHDAIQDLPGSTPARRLLVSKGLEYLDKLAQDASDPGLQRELAAAYVKVGDVQGRPLNPNLGDTPGALASYRKAIGLYEALIPADSADPTVRRELATAYVRLSEVLSSSGDTGEALAFARKGLDLQRVTADASAGGDSAVPPAVRRELAASYSRVGDLLSATGDTKAALEHRRMALAIMQTVTTTAPDDVANLRQLGTSYHKLGNSLGNPNYPNIGDASGALEQLEHATEAFARAAAAQPSNAMLQRNLAIVNSNKSDVLRALGRADEALARQRDAQDAFRKLAEADPSNVTAWNDLAISLSKIAEMLDTSGRSNDALPEYQAALDIHLKLSAGDPLNAALKLEVASDHNRLATAQARVGRRADALVNHAKALEIVQALRASNPKNVELTVAVALARLGRGDAYASFGRRVRGSARRDDLSSAEREYVAGIELLEELLRQRNIEGTDVKTLEAAKDELKRIRADLARTR